MKRHELEVTADRLGDHYRHYYGLLDNSELSAISKVREILNRLAEANARRRP